MKGDNRGQALTELIIIFPVAAILLGAPAGYRLNFIERLKSESESFDAKLHSFAQKPEKTDLKPSSFNNCLSNPGAVLSFNNTHLPEIIEHQRALSLATQRVACLAEATGRLGPKVALPLWGLHIGAPTEKLARATAETLCPRITRVSERLRSGVQIRLRFFAQSDRIIASELLTQATGVCLGALK